MVFLVIYMFFVVLNVGAVTLQWDEANHLNGAQILLQGHFPLYMQSASFYPPLDDVILVGYFAVAGTSLFTARLVSATFSVLALWLVFEFTSRTFGPKTGLIASILLGSMPGFFWSSRIAMLETMLVFFFSASLMTFYFWLQKHDNKWLVLSGVTLGLGFLTKYQAIITIPAMILGVLFLCRGYIKTKLAKLPLLILCASLIALPWIVISYQAYSTGMLNEWMYAMEIGNLDKALYGMRFGPYATPIFYLIEMVWPYGQVHPISFLVYGFCLAGLGYLLWRRKPLDKFLLLWFLVVYVFFSVIGNRQWRYVVPLFPVLAVAAATLINDAYGKLEKTWKQTHISWNRRRAAKIGAVGLVVIVGFSVAYSCRDTQIWLANDAAFNLPTEAAVKYVGDRLGANESLMILCCTNAFTRDIVTFYFYSATDDLHYVGQYPEEPVDAFTPHFDVCELSNRCAEHNVKYLMLFEYGKTYPYFNSTLDMAQVYQMMLDSNNFSLQTILGDYPCSIYILSYM